MEKKENLIKSVAREQQMKLLSDFCNKMGIEYNFKNFNPVKFLEGASADYIVRLKNAGWDELCAKWNEIAASVKTFRKERTKFSKCEKYVLKVIAAGNKKFKEGYGFSAKRICTRSKFTYNQLFDAYNKLLSEGIIKSEPRVVTLANGDTFNWKVDTIVESSN